MTIFTIKHAAQGGHVVLFPNTLTLLKDEKGEVLRFKTRREAENAAYKQDPQSFEWVPSFGAAG